MVETEYILEMKQIVKTFRGVKALDHVDFRLRPQTIHVLMGENGAGKSTLVKILAGEEPQDSGEIIYKGEPISFANPRAALKKGISLIHQELTPILDMTVAENLFLGREITHFKNLVVNMKEINEKSKQLLQEVTLNIDPRTKMKNLSVAQLQMVEIGKTIAYNSDILILDEPTSALSDSEVDVLFNLLKKLIAEGKSIIYISHRMEEIYRIADEISVFRDGNYIGTYMPKNLNRDELIFKMVDRKLNEIYPIRESKNGREILSVKGLSWGNHFNNVNFSLFEGEILGLAGLMGAGRTEIVETIFGINKPDEGKIFIDGKEVEIKSCEDAISYGIGLITDDRKYKGLVLPLSVEDNIALPNYNTNSKHGIINFNSVRRMCNEFVAKLKIKTPNNKQIVNNLSGGNQQKVVLAKWLAKKPRIMFFDEPTKGIDIGAKAEFFQIISDLAKQGVAVIFISSELEELIGMSDRVIVFHEGKIKGELKKNGISQKAIMKLAIGQ
jgi:inositol transport system ATP-binding protein